MEMVGMAKQDFAKANELLVGEGLGSVWPRVAAVNGVDG